MAMACLVDLAPCLRRRILSISSCTNSPACVLGDLPSRLSCLAFRMVCFLGMERSIDDLLAFILSRTTPDPIKPQQHQHLNRPMGAAAGRYGLQSSPASGSFNNGEPFGGNLVALPSKKKGDETHERNRSRCIRQNNQPHQFMAG